MNTQPPDHVDDRGIDAGKVRPSDGEPPPVTDLKPVSLMGRLFGVPLLIISIIIGCAVLVVVLFGTVATDKERPISELLLVLETASGERTVGILLPREKELWQVARELALRLEQKEKELTAEELDEVVRRLAVLLDRFSSRSQDLTDMGLKQMDFVIQALGQTGTPEAVAPLMERLTDSRVETRRLVLQALAQIGPSPATREHLDRIAVSLDDSDSTVRMIACAVISTLATAGDTGAIDSLARAFADEDRDVQWNATLALARLGSSKGNRLLVDMLTRSYWENDVQVRVTTVGSSSQAYPMPPQAVDRYLVAAVEAGQNLADDNIKNCIRSLESDRSTIVRNAAKLAAKSSEPTEVER